jgi:glycosyltransferase involved in cell wall biosynthesis
MLLRGLRARHVWNVNSRLGFDMLVHYGARLALQSRLYAYYFCADRDAAGNEVGYPVWYFANILPHLTAAICDTADLARSLTRRYSLPDNLAARVRTVYTPARTPVADGTLAGMQSAHRAGRLRPRVLWGGRLDRQKRFDLVIALARAMPDVDFDARGKAVLDRPPDLSGLPPNLQLNPPFSEYSQLPLNDADGWLYTSDWDGLPTILIELGAMGMPIVASAVGGVPELIDVSTGWPVDPDAGLEGYEAALRLMLADPEARQERAAALQRRIASRHDVATYEQAVAEIV